MTLSAIIAVAVFLASVVLSQKLAARAASRLDDATKLKIVEVFPKRNSNFTIVIFGIVLVFLLAIYAYPQYISIITVAYGVCFLIYLFAKLFLNLRKLREIGAPENYIRSVVTSFAVFIGGALAAIIVFAIGRGISS